MHDLKEQDEISRNVLQQKYFHYILDDYNRGNKVANKAYSKTLAWHLQKFVGKGIIPTNHNFLLENRKHVTENIDSMLSA